MSVLWIISCAAPKNPGTRAALVKYDTRAHRLTLEAFWLERAPCGDDLCILSAKHGLVDTATPIADYDELMTDARALEIAAQFGDRFRDAVAGHDEVRVFGGKRYRQVVKAWCDAAGLDCVELIGEDRGCGDHFSALKEAITAADLD